MIAGASQTTDSGRQVYDQYKLILDSSEKPDAREGTGIVGASGIETQQGNSQGSADSKTQALINLLPKQEAKDLMTGSPDHSPDPYLIALYQPSSEWAVALTNSDSMQSLFNRIDWIQPGRIQSLPEQDLATILESFP